MRKYSTIEKTNFSSPEPARQKLFTDTLEKTNFSSPEPARQKLFTDTLLPGAVLREVLFYY